MKNLLKRFWKEEDAIGVVEIVLILAVIIVLVLIFRKAIMKFVEDIIGKIFSSEVEKEATDRLPTST